MQDVKTPKYANRRRMFEQISLNWTTGERYIKRGILVPDAHALDGSPLFDIERIELHRQSIVDYRKRLVLERQKIRESLDAMISQGRERLKAVRENALS